MLSTSLMVILIISLVILTGFIYVARFIIGLQKKVNELTVKNNKNKGKIVDNVNNHTVVEKVIKDNTINQCSLEQNEINNNNVLQELGKMDEIRIKKVANHDSVEFGKIINSNRFKIFENNQKETHDYHEANIMQVNKTDGAQATPVNPNRMSLGRTEQLYKLDIVVEKTPINQVLNNDHIERKE